MRLTRRIGMGARLFVLSAVLSAGLSAAQGPAPELVMEGGGRTANTLGLVFGGGDRWVAFVDLQPNGSLGPMRVLDTASGRTIRTLADASPLAAHPTQDLVVVARADAVVGVNPRTGHEDWRLAHSGSWGRVIQARFAPDGSTFLACQMTGMRTLGRQRFTVSWTRRHTADGRAASNPIQLEFDLSSFATSGQGAWVSTDAKWLHVYASRRDASCATRDCWNTELRDVDSGRPAGRLKGRVVASHAGAMRALVAAPGGSGLQTLFANPLTLVDVATGRDLATYVGLSAEFSSDGATLLITGTDTSWTLVDARSGVLLSVSPRSTPSVVHWTMTTAGDRMAGMQKSSLFLVSPADPSASRTFGAGETLQTQEDARQSAAQLVDAVSRPGKLRETAAQTTPAATPAAAFTADGRWFAARAQDGHIDVWDPATGSRLPFRLPPTRSNSGLLVVRAAQIATASSAARDSETTAPVGYLPTLRYPEGLVVSSLGGLTGAGTTDLSACWSPTSLYEPATGDIAEVTPPAASEGTLPKGAGYERAVGCSASPDRTRYLAAVDPKPAAKRRVGVPGSLQVAIVGRESSRPAAMLRDGSSHKPEDFTGLGIHLHWTLDGQFVIGAQQGFSKARLRAWRASDGEEIVIRDEAFSKATIVGFVADSPVVVTTPQMLSGRSPIHLWDVAQMKEVGRLEDVAVGSSLMNAVTPTFASLPLATNEKVFALPDIDGSLAIRRRTSGEVLGRLRVLSKGEWVVTTPSGLFDGSPAGWRDISWRTDGGQAVASGEVFFTEFFRPGLLADLLDGRVPPIDRAIGDRDRRQPRVLIAAAMSGERTARISLDVMEAAADAKTPAGSGVRDLRLFRNGSLVKVWRGDLALQNGALRVDAIVPVLAGDNHFSAYAFNHDDIRSQEAETTVRANIDARPPTVYIVAIGVNAYANPEFNLAYAAPDAKSFGDAVGARQRLIDPTATVRVVHLLDGEATRANILLAVDRLSGRQSGALPAGAPPMLATLAASRPEDTVVLFFAGHGLATGDRFYMIPADMAYRGARAQVGTALSHLLERSISDQDLESALEPVDARHLALIIDACQSGQAIGSAHERQGPMNSRGLAQLAYEKGMSILAASQAYQAALESTKLGHGYLTFALVEEALATDVADRRPADGAVTLDEWFDYAVRRVPALQAEAMTEAGRAGRIIRFDVAPLNPRTSGQLQTPRRFARRDAPGPSLIVWRPPAR